MNKTTIKTTINDIDNAIEMFEDILEVNRKNNIFSRSALQRIQANMINLKTTKHHLEQMLKDLNNDKSSQNNNGRLFDKMLDGAQSLCEENPGLVKGIVDTPKTSEEQIAEDFVEKYLPENFIEDYLNKQ